MLLIVGTFSLVLGLVFGLYWVFVDRNEGAVRRALKRRMKKPGSQGIVRAGLMQERERLSDVGPFDAVLVRMGRVTDPLQRMVSQSGLDVTVGTMLLAAGCVGLLAYALVAWYTGAALIAAAAGAAVSYLPFWLVRMMGARRLLKFEEQFPEAIDLLARALRAGHALTTGLQMVGEEMAAPVGPEFRLLFDRQNFGMPLPQALKDFAQRIPIIDARFFVTAVLTQREAGGNLSEVLDNLSGIIRDRFRVKRQVRVISAHGRITGTVLSGLPIALGLFFAITSPDIYRKFYTDPFGIRMILAALSLQVVGILLIRRIVRIEY